MPIEHARARGTGQVVLGLEGGVEALEEDAGEVREAARLGARRPRRPEVGIARRVHGELPIPAARQHPHALDERRRGKVEEAVLLKLPAAHHAEEGLVGEPAEPDRGRSRDQRTDAPAQELRPLLVAPHPVEPHQQHARVEAGDAVMVHGETEQVRRRKVGEVRPQRRRVLHQEQVAVEEDEPADGAQRGQVRREELPAWDGAGTGGARAHVAMKLRGPRRQRVDRVRVRALARQQRRSGREGLLRAPRLGRAGEHQVVARDRAVALDAQQDASPLEQVARRVAEESEVWIFGVGACL